MRPLFRDQRFVLAEFFANFAVAWLAGGIIAPSIERKTTAEIIVSGIGPLIWAGFSLWAVLFLTRGGKR